MGQFRGSVISDVTSFMGQSFVGQISLMSQVSWVRYISNVPGACGDCGLIFPMYSNIIDPQKLVTSLTLQVSGSDSYDATSF